MTKLRVGIFGAGAIGAYVGVRLAAAGCSVVLVGRRRLVEMARDLSARNVRGDVARPSPDTSLTAVEVPSALAATDVILVAVKSPDTPAAVEGLRGVVGPDSLVVSLQNGLGNADVLRSLPAEVVPGVVAFNVVWDGANLEQTVGGPILVGSSGHPVLPRLLEALRLAKEEAGVRKDIEAVQMGKLLLNLNNGVCAVAGAPLAASFASKPLLRAYAACLREGLEVAAASHHPVASIGRLSPPLIARLLSLPHPVVRRLVGLMVQADPRARSSTLQDLDRGKRTEIDHLNGEIVRLAEEAGLSAPANRFVTERVHELEAQEVLRFLTPEELLRGIRGA
ncbi:MAG: 2-dehydropantoate 2-reductase [Deinococcales bacterium]